MKKTAIILAAALPLSGTVPAIAAENGQADRTMGPWYGGSCQNHIPRLMKWAWDRAC